MEQKNNFLACHVLDLQATSFADSCFSFSLEHLYLGGCRPACTRDAVTGVPFHSDSHFPKEEAGKEETGL